MEDLSVLAVETEADLDLADEVEATPVPDLEVAPDQVLEDSQAASVAVLVLVEAMEDRVDPTTDLP